MFIIRLFFIMISELGKIIRLFSCVNFQPRVQLLDLIKWRMIVPFFRSKSKANSDSGNMTRIKSQTVTIFYIFCYIMMQLLFINTVRGEFTKLVDDINNNTTEGILSRVKRSPFNLPYVLKFRVVSPTGEQIQLMWFQRKNFLANEYLTIILPIGKNRVNVMANIGEFIVYHDDVKNSAIVYYQNSNTLSGFIGLEYIIMNLPYEFDVAGNYLGKEAHRFISKRPYPPLHNLPPIPDTFLEEVLRPSENDGDFIDYQPGTSGELRFKKTQTQEEATYVDVSKVNLRKRRWDPLHEYYYLEILVFINHDVADNYREYFGNDKYVEAMVKDYINYFNAVDMIYQKLRGNYHAMYINIAQIVIGDITDSLEVVNDVGELEFAQTIVKTRQFLQSHQYLHPQDSFDYVFMSTSRSIKHELNLVPGITDLIGDLYNARKNNQWYSAVPITVLEFTNNYSLAVHEIGRILHIEVDSWDRGCKIEGQCYGLMQRGASKCDKCLKWSTQSREQFTEFFGRNLDRCFLLNEPRSLRPPGPSIFLTPHHQCQCYGFSSFMQIVGDMKQYVSSKDCEEPLKCRVSLADPLQFQNTLKPFDGTKCGGSNNKVCWEGRCRYYNSISCPIKL